MAIRNTDTNPTLCTPKLKELLLIENEIDRHLLDSTINGKASYLVSCSVDYIDILLLRYTKSGWIVELGYSGEYMHRLDFIDPAIHTTHKQ